MLKKINKSLSIEQVERFRMLYQKQNESSIIPQEFLELLALLDKIEELNVSRLKYLTALSVLRNMSVRQLVKQLDIIPANG